MTYPDGSLQKYFDNHSWWEKTNEKQPSFGRLIWAFVPHVDIIPKSLLPTGRAEEEASNHSKVSYEIADLRINSHFQKNSLPAAILPCYQGECYTIHRSKKRPVLLISDGGPDIPKQLRSSMKPSWHTNPTLLVAPYYGVLKKGFSKWYEPFVERIKRCEYPQYLWDTLPIPSDTESSILRFDHIQPIGKHNDSYELTEYTLKEDVVYLLNEWIDWLITGEVDRDSVLNEIRNDLLGL
ncbi:MAG: hypothetical protein D3914_09415 [Candidatus Electrothrix sp. LOE2]|nr:hypothetical protein [Candidatus Electrothrix sp. LOE2]